VCYVSNGVLDSNGSVVQIGEYVLRVESSLFFLKWLVTVITFTSGGSVEIYINGRLFIFGVVIFVLGSVVQIGEYVLRVESKSM
jgi:uncharacterized membrane protein YjjP (DUF1212 family)